MFFNRHICIVYILEVLKTSPVLEVLPFQLRWSLGQPGWGGSDQAFQDKADSLHLQHVSEHDDDSSGVVFWKSGVKSLSGRLTVTDFW